jgi:hypothetical protein
MKKYFSINLALLTLLPLLVLAQGTEGTATQQTINQNANVYINNLYKNSQDVAVTSAEQVGTEDDLAILEDNFKILNPNISNISSVTNTDGSTNFTVEYKHPGKFLGLIPGSFKTITTVQTSTNGVPSIDTTFSIWSSLVSEKKFDKEKIISQLQNDPTIQNNLEMNASPAAKARVVEAIVSILDKNELEEIGPTVESSPAPAQNY